MLEVRFMSFATNSSQQISIFDATSNLTQREVKMLEKSWAKFFSENIFPAIDEEPFRVLYSDQPSRKNTPINVIMGALIIKEMFQLTDEEMVETLPFDIRYQYALHTTSFDEQPLNDRTFGRFRARCSSYEEETGIDLIHQCIVDLSSQIAKMMDLNTGMRRMDSLMIAANIKKMSRLELLYTCISNLAKCMNRAKDSALPDALKHYLDSDDHNKVLYHNRSEDNDSKISQVLKDAALIISACGSRYDEYSEYQLMLRVIKEQTDEDKDGNLVLKHKQTGMDSKILQNPADPDATFRSKAGKDNRGYIANIVETSDGTNSVVSDYQLEQNIYSDSQFLKDYISASPKSDTPITMVTDGGYCGYENVKAAKDKNITLVTTDFKGADVADIYADFTFSDDGKEILMCPSGNKPKSNVYDKNADKCKASFPIDTCKNCPHLSECNPEMHVRVATVKLAKRTAYHAEQQRCYETEDFKKHARFRNGVETIPAALRKRHNVDKMPVRGLIRNRQFFGFKVAALNTFKLIKYKVGLSKCAQLSPVMQN